MNVPELRFKGFKKEWDFCSVGDFYYFKNGLNKGKEFFGFGTPIVNFTDVFNNRGLTSDILKGRVSLSKKEISSFEVKKGDIFFTRTSETLEEIGYPSVMLDESNDTVFSGFVLRGRAINKDPLSDLFKKYVFFTNNFRKEMTRKSSMTTRALTSGTSIKKMEFYFPENKMEQEKIGIFHSIIEKEIIFITTKIKLLKQIKAASLQSMFPHEGETIPKVRFKGFEERWLLMKINDICKQSASRLSENSLGPNTGNYAVYGANGYLQNITTYDYDCPYIGIIKDGSGAGRSRLYPKYSSIIGTMQYIIPKGTINIEFLACLFETINFTRFIIGSSIPHIYYKNYCENIVPIPSYNEQQKIGAYFRNLDRQISLQTQRLEKLKQIKAACLDKMFV